MASTKKKLTKEEELLLQDFSRNVTTKSSALFYGNAFIVSAVSVWPSWRIHQVDILQPNVIVLLVLMTVLSTYLISLAYKNVKFVLKHKIALKRAEAVNREVMEQVGSDKKITKHDKEERILWKKNEVADYEATTFSIFYNNALYLLFVVLLSFYILRSVSPLLNYVLSIGVSAGFLLLLSTGTSSNK